MNVSTVLNWIKANVFIVVFVVVMLAALVALPIVSSKLNAGVGERMNELLSMKREMEGLERSTIEVSSPGLAQPVSGTGVVNSKWVAQYTAFVDQEKGDAASLVERAEAHNRKGRGVLHEQFPNPIDSKIETLPRNFHRELRSAYEALLDRVNAGPAPSAEEIAESIAARKNNFIVSKLQQDPGDALTDEQLGKLREFLVEARVGICIDRADSLSFYVAPNALAIPEWQQDRQYSLRDLYFWQWDYWVTEDVLLAIAAANQDARTIRQSPVKRLIMLQPGDIVRSAASPSGGGGGMSPAGGMNPGAGGGRGAVGGSAVPAVAPDPKMPVQRNFATSVTGRATNPLYDVRMVHVEVIVDTARIPELLDALAEQNFMTVLDMRVAGVNAFDAVRNGYYYGVDSVSHVSLDIETIWLRTWTAQFMPTEVKQEFGVPIPQPLPSDAPAQP